MKVMPAALLKMECAQMKACRKALHHMKPLNFVSALLGSCLCEPWVCGKTRGHQSEQFVERTAPTWLD
jgi:hypothetical protein